MRYYIVAGEKSADLHASNLVRAIKDLDGQAQFRGIGGQDMKEAGVLLAKDYKEFALMGFWEVVKNLNKFSKLLAFCKNDIVNYRPDAVILVDFGGFNLRLAKYVKQKGFKTLYYISPKIWAWNTNRAYQIKKYVDKMFVILPFEKAFYQKFGYEVEYVGNPVLDAIKAFQKNHSFLQENGLTDKKIIAILPGSRKQEIELILKLMIEIESKFPDYQFVVAGVSSVSPSLYAPAISAGLPVVFEQTYNLLSFAHAALVTSGTATLETALFKVPQVVCYKTSALTFFIAKSLIKVKYISLPNLLLNKALLKELLQKELNSAALTQELNLVLGQNRDGILEGYQQIEQLLQGPGASITTAGLIVNSLKPTI
jgi:lipid-A-disaccharide synthase